MEIEFAGQLTKNDLRKSLKLHYKPTRLAGAIRIILIVLVILAYVVYLTFYSRKDLVEELGILLPLVIILYVVAYPFIRPYESPSGFLKDTDLKKPLSGKITDQTITIKGANMTSELKWALYEKQKRIDELVLLYQGKNWFNPFPRHFFRSEQDWKAFLQLAEENIPRSD